MHHHVVYTSATKEKETHYAFIQPLNWGSSFQSGEVRRWAKHLAAANRFFEQPMYRSKCCLVSYDVGTNSLAWYQVRHLNRVPLIVSSCAWNSPSTQQNNSIQIPQIQPAGTISKAKKVHVKRHNTLSVSVTSSYALYPSIRFCTLFDIKLVQRTHTIRSTLIKCWYERKHQEHRK